MGGYGRTLLCTKKDEESAARLYTPFANENMATSVANNIQSFTSQKKVKSHPSRVKGLFGDLL